MKKVKILLLIALGMAYVSCEDAYDIQQDGLLDENVTFLSVSDMGKYLTGIYANQTIAPEIGFTSIFTDETSIAPSNAGQNLDLYKFFLTNNDGFASGIWLDHYSTINYVARLFRGASTITPANAGEQAEYNAILAEARVLRAFAYLQLMSYYSEDMKNDASKGVIILDHVPTLDEQLPRSTTGEVWAFIESDLAQAEADFTERYAASKAYFYVSLNMIHALKARMYAYRGNYTQAELFADQVIADEASHGVTLTPAGFVETTSASGNGSSINATAFASGVSSDYRRIWTDDIQGEVIWSLSRAKGGDGVAGYWYTNNTSRQGDPLHDMGRNLFKLLMDQNGDGTITNMTSIAVNPTDHDVRARAFVDPSALVAANPETTPNWRTGDVLCIDKYPGLAGQNNLLRNDLKVFRLSEMYLIKAEARAAAGDLDGVATILKTIRDARTFELRKKPVNNTTPGVVLQPAIPAPLPVYADATSAWADILMERRKELCFEGHRYIDLRRLGVLAGGVSIDRFHRDCDDNAVPVCELDLNDHRYILPIPVGEIIGNPLIEQNPGY